jgi:hypothetical protein
MCETEHLVADRLDRDWLRWGNKAILLGLIDDLIEWSAECGPEPDWFAGELDSLHDRWTDARAFQYCQQMGL